MTIHYWKVALYLAWFANLTQQSGLALLRGHLNKPQHRAQRRVKFAVMGLLTGLLTAAVIPTAYFNWSSLGVSYGQWSPGASGDYAWCFVDIPTATRMLELRRQEVMNNPPSNKFAIEQSYSLRNLKSFEDMVLSVVLLFSTFSTKVLKGSMRVSDCASNRIRISMRSWAQGRIEWILGQDLHSLLTPKLDEGARLPTFMKGRLLLEPLIALYLTGHVYTEFATSMMFEVCLVTLVPSISSLAHHILDEDTLAMGFNNICIK